MRWEGGSDLARWGSTAQLAWGWPVTTEPCGISFPVSNQLSSGRERAPGAAGSEGELLAQVLGAGGVGGRVWGGGTYSELSPSLQGHPGKRGHLGDTGRQGKPVSVSAEGPGRVCVERGLQEPAPHPSPFPVPCGSLGIKP